MPPTLERFLSSRATRATVYACPPCGPTPPSVRMWSSPRFVPASFPERRPPPRIGTRNPSDEMPIPAAEEEASDREHPGVLQEERTLLRERDAEAGQIGLDLVDLDLREVRVVREVQRQPLRDLDLGVAPALLILDEIGLTRGVVAGGGDQEIRRHLGRAPDRWLDTDQRARLAHPVEVELARDGRPE